MTRNYVQETSLRPYPSTSAVVVRVPDRTPPAGREVDLQTAHLSIEVATTQRPHDIRYWRLFDCIHLVGDCIECELRVTLLAAGHSTSSRPGVQRHHVTGSLLRTCRQIFSRAFKAKPASLSPAIRLVCLDFNFTSSPSLDATSILASQLLWDL